MKSKTHSHNGNGSTIDSSGSSSPSPPRSPRRHFSISHCRRRLPLKAFSRTKKLGSFAVGTTGHRNLRYFFLVPLLCFSGFLMFVGPFLVLIGRTPVPGSIYHSHEIFQKLWPDIEADNSTAIELFSVWQYKKKLRKQKHCPNIAVV